MYKRTIFLVVKILLSTGLLLYCILPTTSCEGTKANRPPSIWLTSGPPEGSVTSYKVNFMWHGFDPDGDVRHYEYAITDNEYGVFDPADTTGPDNWVRTRSLGGDFTFTADQLEDSSDTEPPMQPAVFMRSHTFFIRAVDDQWLATPKPAYRSFTAMTLSPEVDITIPVYQGLNPALAPRIATFCWTATDYIDDYNSTQEPDSVRWILLRRDLFNDSYEQALEYIRQTPDAPEWYPWQEYKESGENGMSWTTPLLDFGYYLFAVQAKDEAGAVTPVFDEMRNVRRVMVTHRTSGPLLSVRNRYIKGTIRSVTVSSDFTIVDFPAGLPVEFEWWATAENYGGIVSGYRYGWDIEDFNDDGQWAVDWTPFRCQGCKATSPPAGYYYGTHTFHVEVMDNAEFKSRVGVKINFFPFTGERDLLVVDDYYEDPTTSGMIRTNGAQPNDEEHDAFWGNALNNVADFNPVFDLVEVSRAEPLSITKLLQYKSVIWDAYGGYDLLPNIQPFLHEMIKFVPEDDPHAVVTGKVQPNILALYLAMGGHILICGRQPMTGVFNDQYFIGHPKFPFILKYEIAGDQDGNYNNQIDDPVGDNSFPYREMCIDVIDIAYCDQYCLRRDPDNGCGVTHIRGARPREDGLRESLPIDPNFPSMTLRPEAAGPGKFYAPDSRGLNTELYNPPYFTCGFFDLGPRPCFELIYGNGCLDVTSAIYGAPIASWTTVFEDVYPDVPGGIEARSCVWGFEPFFFDTTAVREALEVILFDEWKLPRK